MGLSNLKIEKFLIEWEILKNQLDIPSKYWDRTGTILSPKTAGDNVNLGTGNIWANQLSTTIANPSLPVVIQDGKIEFWERTIGFNEAWKIERDGSDNLVVSWSDGLAPKIFQIDTDVEWDGGGSVATNAHIADNSQAHTDYLINNGDDSTSGILTALGFATEFMSIGAKSISVGGGESLTLSATSIIVPTNLYVNQNSTTALLVEDDGTKDNVLVVDTSNGRVGINQVPAVPLHVKGVSRFTDGTAVMTITPGSPTIIGMDSGAGFEYRAGTGKFTLKSGTGEVELDTGNEPDGDMELKFITASYEGNLKYSEFMGNGLVDCFVFGDDVDFPNNIKLLFGNGFGYPSYNTYAEMYHSGSDLYLNNDVGTLYIDSTEYINITPATSIRLGQTSTNFTEIKSDGEINLHGTARVKKSLWLPFEVLKAPGTKPADYIDHGISGAWSFSDGTDDTVVFLAEVPPDMDRSEAPTLKIGWSTNTTATDETAVWQIEYLWMAPGEDTTAEAQEILTINSNAVAQANGLIIAEFTGIDAPDETDVCVHCRLKRLGADGNDDLTDTAEVHGVCLSYFADKLGEAT